MTEQTCAQTDTKCQQDCMQEKLEPAPIISGVIDVEIHSRWRQSEKCCSLL